MRVVERLLARGLPPDDIERVVASWLPPFRFAPSDAREATRRVGLPALGRGLGSLLARVDALAVAGSGGARSPARARAPRRRWRASVPAVRWTRRRAAVAKAAPELAREVDLAAVRIHDDDDADALCREVGARAFAVGDHIAFRRGAFRPDSRDGLALLGHELTHVGQQRRPGCHGLRESAGLEREARAMASAIAARGEVAPEAPRPTPLPGADAPRARAPDALLAEAKRTLARLRIRPGALFVVCGRVAGFDAFGKALGVWQVTAPVPLTPGYWLDGRVGVEAWSELAEQEVIDACGERGGDIWVVAA
ncbi:MAG: DUF4157 domain-containing protein [Myxococcota bacterium]